MQLRNMKIGIRAAGMFTLLGVLVLALGLVALYETRRMDSATDEIRLTWMPAVLALGEVSSNLGRARALTLRSVLEDSSSARHSTLDKIVQVNQQLERDLKAYERTIFAADDRALFDTFMGLSERYHALQQAIRVAAGNDQLDEARRLVNGPLAEYADSMMKALAELIDYNTKGAEQASLRSSAASDEAFSLIIGAIAVITLALIGIATLLTRSIVVPLADAVAVAERVATGDLTREIVVLGHDEPALLLAALSRMQHSLRDTLRRIAASSDQLASASEELHTVTEDTSRGLHQQSAEIDQAATAVNQMTAAVEEVASNAVSTADASQGADRTTRDGRDQVNQALASIQHLVDDVTGTSGEIEQLASHANEISQVLDVIGSIAGQTNLLALNAAIEAARAGEAGRGFAVVADEVRALAHRTQQSTAEIEQMIGGIQSGTERAVSAMHSSQGRANGTLAVAQSAGQALELIAEAIATINQRNLVIATASEQQAQVAREVDRNLVNIRDLAMQTSAGANQTSAAAQDLSRLAVELNGMVAQFKV
ncbi:chemotaxis protein [Pseudomonas sp. 250J]|uniref:Methyl-accepting chemotaxis protein n=2 Tax=Pseudomonas TaxID=286 RepID=A0ABT2VH11_9PSED|nr:MULTISPECIES: methyl-accepting chemotaxis protein [Pseudomonas]KNX77560.1 chemotaxis protein [Pseudomonas sp. 250J]MCU7240918.1 methyl-accepting chemotaxis protein [Pseudomonas peradeniyensis]MCU7281878.1 methyl-accepting chemotaxis protein [Pseudomonas peradeniyensis]QZA56726.1 methyl-accepting chemotaxis protein [Pseudomonas sp. 2hn]